MYRNCSAYLRLTCLFIYIRSQIRILICIHGHICYIRDCKTGICTGQTMFMIIQSIDFNLFRNSKADRLIDQLEDNEHCYKNESINCYKTNCLNAQLSKSTTIEEAKTYSIITCREETNSKGAPDTIYHMNGYRTNGVINLRNVIEEFNREYYKESSNKSDEESSYRRYTISTGCNCNQTCK